nr:unnamed protein product [Callosobruchus chinensis]
MGLWINAHLAKLWTSYANVIKFSLACCVRLYLQSSDKFASPNRNLYADVIFP